MTCTLCTVDRDTVTPGVVLVDGELQLHQVCDPCAAELDAAGVDVDWV